MDPNILREIFYLVMSLVIVGVVGTLMVIIKLFDVLKILKNIQDQLRKEQK